MNSSIFIALLLIGVIALIIVLLVMVHKRDNHKNRKKRMELFQQLTNGHNLQISEKEFFNDQLIALDPTRKTLVIADFSGPAEQVKLIELEKVGFCHVERTTQTHRSKDMAELIIHSISLQLLSPAKALLWEFVFFDFAKHSISNVEFLGERAAHWKNRITEVKQQAPMITI